MELNALERNSAKQIKVLLADDSEDNRFLLDLYLRRKGISVELAHDGRQAVEKANSGDYDVVLMDVEMPGLDGCSATIELRRTGYARPILALTAHTSEAEIQRTTNAGCNGHITKPLDCPALLKTIQNLAGQSPTIETLEF